MTTTATDGPPPGLGEAISEVLLAAVAAQLEETPENRRHLTDTYKAMFELAPGRGDMIAGVAMSRWVELTAKIPGSPFAAPLSFDAFDRAGQPMTEDMPEAELEAIRFIVLSVNDGPRVAARVLRRALSAKATPKEEAELLFDVTIAVMGVCAAVCITTP